MASIYEMRDKHKDKFGLDDLLGLLTTGVGIWDTIQGAGEQKRQFNALAEERAADDAAASLQRQEEQAYGGEKAFAGGMADLMGRGYAMPEGPMPEDFGYGADETDLVKMLAGGQLRPPAAVDPDWLLQRKYDAEHPKPMTEYEKASLAQRSQPDELSLMDLIGLAERGVTVPGAEPIIEQSGGPLIGATNYQPVNMQQTGVRIGGATVPMNVVGSKIEQPPAPPAPPASLLSAGIPSKQRDFDARFPGKTYDEVVAERTAGYQQPQTEQQPDMQTARTFVTQQMALYGMDPNDEADIAPLVEAYLSMGAAAVPAMLKDWMARRVTGMGSGQ
jgi:hypothetical protein